MNGLNLATVSLLLVLGASGLMSDASPDNSAATSSADAPIDNLYEYLLQREYPSAIGYADHQIRRKAVRSPSLRLRFGKREPDQNQDKEEETFDRIVRAPNLRLRFGKREPNLWSSNEDNEDSLNDQQKQIDDDFVNQRMIRAPQLRLRYGRSSPSEEGNKFDFLQKTVYSQGTKMDPQVKSRLGRSPWENSLNEDSTDDQVQNEDEFVDQRIIRAPQLRLRYGRSFPSENANSFDFSRFLRRADEDTKRAPQLRLRFGRSLSENSLNEDENMKRFARDPEDAKRAPTLRMRFGRSSPDKIDRDQ